MLYKITHMVAHDGPHVVRHDDFLGLHEAQQVILVAGGPRTQLAAGARTAKLVHAGVVAVRGAEVFQLPRRPVLHKGEVGSLVGRGGGDKAAPAEPYVAPAFADEAQALGRAEQFPALAVVVAQRRRLEVAAVALVLQDSLAGRKLNDVPFLVGVGTECR